MVESRILLTGVHILYVRDARESTEDYLGLHFSFAFSSVPDSHGQEGTGKTKRKKKPEEQSGMQRPRASRMPPCPCIRRVFLASSPLEFVHYSTIFAPLACYIGG